MPPVFGLSVFMPLEENTLNERCCNALWYQGRVNKGNARWDMPRWRSKYREPPDSGTPALINRVFDDVSPGEAVFIAYAGF